MSVPEYIVMGRGAWEDSQRVLRKGQDGVHRMYLAGFVQHVPVRIDPLLPPRAKYLVLRDGRVMEL